MPEKMLNGITSGIAILNSNFAGLDFSFDDFGFDKIIIS